MKPLDPDLESLLREWIEKAEADLEAAEQLAPSVASSIRLREIVGFHCQQAIVFCGLLGWACGPRNFMKNSQSGIMTKA
jgi:hypothetical protein